MIAIVDVRWHRRAMMDHPQDDVSELEQLRAKFSQLEDIIRCLPVGLIFIDDDDKVAIANPIGAEIRCVGDRLGASVAECHPDGTHQTLGRVLQRFRDEPQLQEHPIVLERMHRYEVTYSRVRGLDGCYRGVLWMSHDISRRKQLEGELLHAERLAGLGRMAAKVAHDIKNPLNAIQGAAHFMQQGEPSESQSAELTALIKDQVTRISDLVTHLNEITRPFELSFESIDVVGALREQLETLVVSRPAIRWSLHPSVETENVVPCDRALFERLVSNAVENAAIAMDGAGVIEVDVKQHHTEDGGWVDIVFMDRGPGFPERVLKNAFQPFLTTRPEGTGLGLTIMREICLLHGGDLTIENTESGARVVARLSAR